MTSSEVKRAVLQLPRAERLEVIRLAWQSVASERDLDISKQELALLEERIRDHEADPEDGIPWEEIKAELWPQS